MPELADGHFEGEYKGERVAISHFNRKLQVYWNNEWIEVPPREVEVAYTLRLFKNGKLAYSAVSDTRSSRYLPSYLPSGWLAVS
jgi:hypothetical protein